MPGRFKNFIDDLNEQERRAAEERAIEQAQRQKIAAEFDIHWRAVLKNLKETVEGCFIRDSPFEWVGDSEGINVASVGLHWSRMDGNGSPLVELTLGSPVGIRSFLAEQEKSLPPEQHLLSPIISGGEFRWRFSSRLNDLAIAEFTDEDVADEIAMMLAQYADEYEKLRAKFDPFAAI